MNLERLVNLVVARLVEREQRVYSVSLPQLRLGLEPAVYLQHATLHLLLPDPDFMQQLATGNSAEPAVAALHEAWSWGLRVHISLHQQLLRTLPRQALQRLPLSLSDHQGQPVRLSASRLLSYGDIATLGPCWLIISPKARVTPLAQDYLSARRIQLLRQE
ncbi:MAG: microcompartment protein PduM [Chania sp.]